MEYPREWLFLSRKTVMCRREESDEDERQEGLGARQPMERLVSWTE